ncbi:MAG: Do family serine endopeptidase [Thermoguttaceae bacterium]
MKRLLGNKLSSWVLVVLALAVVGLLVAGSIAREGLQPAFESTSAATTSEGSDFAKSLSAAFRRAAEEALPSVVKIYRRPLMVERPSSQFAPEEDPFDEWFPFGDMFRRNPELRRFFRDLPRGLPSIPRRGLYGSGSGVIIDRSGIVLTNSHVVEGDGKVVVRLLDGREFEDVEIKADPKTDLAIVRIKGAQNLKAARLGDSDKLAVGDWVLALGGPFDLEGTVTAGIISAKGRGLRITDRADFLQTDAAINPGNSGGPLVNLDGEVVGINTAISSNTGVNMGIGFAVPINMAKWVAEQLVRTGEVRRAYLGVGIQAITQQLADQVGVKAKEGVLVTEVFPDSPAARAGLKTGDVIVAFAGQPVPGPEELQGMVERTPIGQNVSVEVVREGRRISLQVRVEKQPADYGVRSRPAAPGFSGPEGSRLGRLGIDVEPLTKEVAEQLGLRSTEGVVITQVRPGSLADMAGLESGMVIVQANRKPVASAEDLRKAIEAQPLEKGLLLLVRTAEGTRFVVIRADRP